MSVAPTDWRMLPANPRIEVEIRVLTETQPELELAAEHGVAVERGR